ncbi:MAG TPA: T9SS type A sorting domain-containing protein, partial [Candidatus Kapabacteria bacterium]
DGSRQSQYSDWQDDSLEGFHFPFDTSILPLQDLGDLDTLFARHFLFSVGIPAGIITSVSAYPNPTGTGTVISFGIAKEAYVKIELYDVLGHAVGSAGFESLFEPGNKAVPISLAALPSGTYFARIQTAYGEVESVKIVKE